MTGTALGASSGKSTRTITFKNEAHKKFYMEYLQKCRYQDVYHKALVYCLGLNSDTRDHVDRIYDLKKDMLSRNVCMKAGRPVAA